MRQSKKITKFLKDKYCENYLHFYSDLLKILDSNNKCLTPVTAAAPEQLIGDRENTLEVLSYISVIYSINYYEVWFKFKRRWVQVRYLFLVSVSIRA